MPSPVALVVRLPHHHALAACWDVLTGTLALPVELPAPGTEVVVDGRVGEVAFLLGGRVVAGAEGTWRIAVERQARPVVEALLLPPQTSSAATPRSRAVA